MCLHPPPCVPMLRLQPIPGAFLLSETTRNFVWLMAASRCLYCPATEARRLPPRTLLAPPQTPTVFYRRSTSMIAESVSSAHSLEGGLHADSLAQLLFYEAVVEV